MSYKSMRPGGDVAETLDTLIAKQAITETLHRYCYAVDRIDQELGDQIWHPDGVANYGPAIFEGTGAGFVRQVFELHRLAKGTSHQVTNIMISLEGDRATSECYVHACIRMDDATDIVVRGRYLDTWSCRGGKWRIDERRYENDLTQVLPANATIEL
jgi:hypothetical protein